MLARLGQVLIVVSCGVVTVTSALCAPANSSPSPLNRAAECMLNVLKTVPGVDEPELENFSSGIWARPLLKYRYTNKKGEKFTVTFLAQRRDHSDYEGFSLHADLPGLFTPGTAGPDDWGTIEITKRWKAECGADTDVLYN